MKLITLNTWGGRRHDDLISFLKREAGTTDVFCLQEVLHEAAGKVRQYTENHVDLLRDIRAVLPEHAVYFHPYIADFYGQAMFVRSTSQPVKVEDIFVYEFRGYDPDDLARSARNVQIATFDAPKKFSIVNFHGLWNGKGKGDSSERLEQSRKIIETLKSIEGEIILCGDFNLNPDTESLAIIEAAGLRNLVKEFGITSTRTSFYKKEGKFADYVMVSKGIKVKDFKVLPDEVSDHAPLMLDFDV